jgi:hypothetical protein
MRRQIYRDRIQRRLVGPDRVQLAPVMRDLHLAILRVAAGVVVLIDHHLRAPVAKLVQFSRDMIELFLQLCEHFLRLYEPV